MSFDGTPRRRCLAIRVACLLLPLCQVPEVPGSNHVKAQVIRAPLNAKAEQKKLGLPGEALLQVDNLLERAGAFNDPIEKILAFTGLASAVCRHDQKYGRELFERAYQLLELSEANESDISGRARERPERMTAGMARGRLMSAIAQCDVNLARRLIGGPSQRTGADTPPTSKLYLGSARALLDNSPEQAKNLATRAVQEGLAGENLISLALFLNHLRAKDEAAADELFLATIDSLRRRHDASINEALNLGLYLFSSPGGLDQPDAIARRSVGGVPIVAVSSPRPGISRPAAAAYLDLAVSLLIEPAQGVDDAKLRYVAANQLLPNVAGFLPQCVMLLSGAIETLRYGIPSALVGQVATAFPSAATVSAAEDLSKIEGIPDQARREELYTYQIMSLVRRREFASARRIADKVRVKDEVKTTFRVQVDFAEANYFLERSEIESAQRIIDKLPPGLAVALLRLGLAQALAKVPGRREEASANVFAALRDAEYATSEQRPYLILAAAGIHAEVDVQSALQMLGQGVRALNESYTQPGKESRERSPASAPPTELRPRSGGWDFVAPVGKVSVPLAVKGVRAYDFQPVLARLMAEAPQETEAIVTSVLDEKVLGHVLPALAEAILNRHRSSGKQ